MISRLPLAADRADRPVHRCAPEIGIGVIGQVEVTGPRFDQAAGGADERADRQFAGAGVVRVEDVKRICVDVAGLQFGDLDTHGYAGGAGNGVNVADGRQNRATGDDEPFGGRAVDACKIPGAARQDQRVDGLVHTAG